MSSWFLNIVLFFFIGGNYNVVLVSVVQLESVVIMYMYRSSQVALVVKNLACQCRRRSAGSIPGSARSPGGGGRGNPLQYSCLENPLARGAWWVTVHRDVKSQIQLK